MELDLAAVGEALSRTGGPWTALESAYVGNALPSTAPGRSDRSLGQDTASAPDGARASARLGLLPLGILESPGFRDVHPSESPRPVMEGGLGQAVQRKDLANVPSRHASPGLRSAPARSGSAGGERRRKRLMEQETMSILQEADALHEHWARLRL